MPRERYVITVDRPDGVSIQQMSQYVREAVSMWAGQYRPPGSWDGDDRGDPRWPIFQSTVWCKRVVREKPK